MNDPPRVSCIMPTRNRPRFVEQAAWYFLRQDYPERELIVVDDGEDPAEPALPSDARIRYVRLDGRRSVGAKRNLACELAAGELIAHWDDDDWSAPDRLSRQVAELQATDAQACALSEVLYYRLSAGEAWLYRAPVNGRPAVAGCTLLYQRAAWSQSPFPDVDVGEDAVFIRALPPDRVHRMSDRSLYVAVVHAGNAGDKTFRPPCWERRPLDEVDALLAGEREFYASLRNGRPNLAPRLRRPDSLTLVTHFVVYDGYGSVAEYLALGLARAGATVDVVPLHIDPAGLTPELQELVARARPQPGAPVLYFDPPGPDAERFARTSSFFFNTMWESSRLPRPWVRHLQQAQAVIVPTRWAREAFAQSGVTVPIEVVPEGVDPDVYHLEPRPERSSLTTLIVGTYVPRKHVAEGIAAWKEVFAGDQEARLVIKARFGYRNFQPDDPRIEFVDENETSRGIASWYRRADVLLALGNEGFGLPLVEGMATGLPVIALNAEGQSDVCAEAGELVLAVSPERWEPHHDTVWGSCGMRAVPDVGQVTARLRWVNEHRAEARELGAAASHWVRRERDVWAKAPAVLDIVERRSRPPRRLRRLRTLWTPSWGRECGVAEYTAHLVDGLHGLRVVADPPEMGSTRLLHVQHETKLFDDAVLARSVREAAAAGVPVLVTEHGVSPAPRPWEREAAALVALTDAGAAMLRTRWPGKRVEKIPHGCPTWFPPRKRGRGRTIGAFGFLERHKGFWSLLEAVREIRGARLLLFAHARSSALEAEWREACVGLPVTWVQEYLPAEEVARRLAAEADVLAFWYDAVPFLSASGAVRVGLASGVPVLGSRTRWFEELDGAVYRTDDLAGGVQRLLEDTALRDELAAAARDYCWEHSWPRTAERHTEMWREIEAA